ncbi:hypothetical protein ACOME3_003210 [Neoechinorhynchus agilis]
MEPCSVDLRSTIEQWNRCHLSMFQVKRTSYGLHGVIRVVYRENCLPHLEDQCAKCIRVTDKTTVQELVGVLIQKFRPDLKNLSSRDDFCLFEVLVSQQSEQIREMDAEERPLLIQIQWPSIDAKQFVLRRRLTTLYHVECNGHTSVEVEHSKDQTLVVLSLSPDGYFEEIICDEDCLGNNGTVNLKCSLPLAEASLSPCFYVVLYGEDFKVKSLARLSQSDQKMIAPNVALHVVDFDKCVLRIDGKLRFGEWKVNGLAANCDYSPLELNPGDRSDNRNMLPALLEVRGEKEDYVIHQALAYSLDTVTTTPKSSIFRLTATFSVYMIIRYRFLYSSSEDHETVRAIVARFVSFLRSLIDDAKTSGRGDTLQLVTLLSNLYEFHFFLTRDIDLSSGICSVESGNSALACQDCFDLLLQRFKVNISESPEDQLVQTLDDILNIMCHCQLCQSLHHQIIVHVFNFVNASLLQGMIVNSERRGSCMTAVLRVTEWASHNNLQRFADSYMAQCHQAVELLKSGPSQSPVLDLLSPAQINALLGRRPPGEYQRQSNFAMSLRLPLTLGQASYSEQVVCGLPHGLLDFIEPLCMSGHCRLLINEKSDGRWTQFISSDSSTMNIAQSTTVEEVKIHKRRGGIGLSIVAARGAHQPHQGIYIKSILEGGAAEADGRLEPGDQIIYVNQMCLLDVSQEQAAAAMTACGSVLTLLIGKHAARLHGLHKLLGNAEDQEEGKLLQPRPGSIARHVSFQRAVNNPSQKMISQIRKDSLSPLMDETASDLQIEDEARMSNDSLSERKLERDDSWITKSTLRRIQKLEDSIELSREQADELEDLKLKYEFDQLNVRSLGHDDLRNLNIMVERRRCRGK